MMAASREPPARMPDAMFGTVRANETTALVMHASVRPNPRW